MDWTLLVVLLVVFQPALSVFFTVDAERTTYTSEFGGKVILGCKFYPRSSNTDPNLKVTWHFSSNLEVIRMDNGTVHSTSPKYQGRVRLLTEELKQGYAKIEISQLRIDDSGTYQCLVQTGEGADYKTISLSVKAPYKTVTKHVERSAEGSEVLLTCLSEGYPESPVVWKDSHQHRHTPNTTIAPTKEKLFKITSQIRVSASKQDSYWCNFTNDGYTETFHIPDEIPAPGVKNDAIIVVLSIGVTLIVIIAGVVTYHRRKGCRLPSTDRTRKSLDRSLSATVCLQIEKENINEIMILNSGHKEENLGSYLKAYYSTALLNAEVRNHCGAFSEEELPHRLHNNDGQSVSLQALLPEAGGTHFLEGPPGSGKTTAAHILVSCWTDGPADVPSNPLDLSVIHLLLYVNCSNVKEDLFQEIENQLSLAENITTELRTVLTTSSQALLVLDGYQEGNHQFDDSFRKFLSEREDCRVLVMCCPGHCPSLIEAVGAQGLLKLEINSAK
ncbi:uncharacterized protein KZ484_026747 [Pholidichthys leucotaenia]